MLRVNVTLEQTELTTQPAQNCCGSTALIMNTTIGICGGGACGLAVLLSLLGLARDQGPFQTIYVFETRSQVGPGLAYSEDSGQTIINMRADTMGLCASDPLHFSRWLDLNRSCAEYGSYPPRQLYGAYLSWIFQSASNDAKLKNIHLQIVHQEVVAISTKNQTFEIRDDRGRTFMVDKVVLALGNFPICSQPHLTNRPGYFQSPWPLQKLNAITSESSVCIVGSRLSGIDAVIHMADNGHKGPLILVSRGGRLPKVQSRQLLKPYKGQYALHVIARDLEEIRAEPASLEWLFDKFRSLAEELDLKDWSSFFRKNDPLLQISLDIQDAEEGTLQWRSLGDAAAPLFERFWDALAVDDQQAFSEKWNSLWYSYVHAMPYENAVRLKLLMEEGRVVVSDVVEIQYNSSGFTITTSDQKLSADYIVEASGLETRVSSIQSRLVECLLSRKILTPHPLGGFSVNRDTLESTTTDRIHVIGSLTSGVHFYTNGIDRNAIHASRIARHIAGLPLLVCKHIALILPDHDAWGSFLANVVPKLLERHLVPFVYIAKESVFSVRRSTNQRPSPFSRLPHAQSGYIHRSHDHEESGGSGQDWSKIRDTLGLSVNVCNVFDAAFPNLLTEHHIDIALVPVDQRGCEQIFGSTFEHHYIVKDPPFCAARKAELSATSSAVANAEQTAIGVVLHYLYNTDKS